MHGDREVNISHFIPYLSQVPLSMVLISEHFLDLFSSPNPDLEQLFSAKNFPISPKTIDPWWKNKIPLDSFDPLKSTVNPSRDLPHQVGDQGPLSYTW